MTYLNAMLAGVAGAFAGIVVALLAHMVYVFALLLPQIRGTGSGGVGAVSFGIDVWVPVLLLGGFIGFVLGYRWQRRRAARRLGVSGGPTP